ncbi:NAD(P)H-dependent glycerol-3-phosphate dehydrogenase [Halanaerocella petrolearia]
MKDKVAVIGGGSWGTALALQLHRNGYQVCIQDVSKQKVTEINQEHRNSYLPDIELPVDLQATTDLEEAVTEAKLVVVVVPSHVMRTVAQNLQGLIADDTIIVSASKGLEEGTNLRMTEILAEELTNHQDQVVALSGPTHAEEVVLDHPTTVVVAHKDKKLAQQVQDIFMSDKFRVYTNPDVVGVELGATVKNSIAIAAGIADGLGYGDNAIAALVTRGITEIKRLGVAMGAKAMTFAGLTGLGDLVVTCTSRHSRNRRLGHKIGSGNTLGQALDEMQMIAEGVKTTKAVHSLAQELNVEMPIVGQVYQILFEDKEPKEAVNNLMLRGKKHEIEAVAKVKAW